jgi:hypothetical protein
MLASLGWFLRLIIASLPAPEIGEDAGLRLGLHHVITEAPPRAEHGFEAVTPGRRQGRDVLARETGQRGFKVVDGRDSHEIAPGRET